jgi:hypothetical protein
VNGDLSDWLKTVTNGLPRSSLAIVGRYTYGKESHFVAVTFSGEQVPQREMPQTGMFRVDLR